MLRSTLAACREVIEFSIELDEWDANGCSGNGEGIFGEVLDTLSGDEPCAATDRIHQPDILDAHGEIILDALGHAGKRVFGGKDLDANQGWNTEDRTWCDTCSDGADVGDAKACGGDLDALFREWTKAPLTAVVKENREEEALDGCMRCLAQVALLDFAVDIVAVRAVGGGEILADRDEDGRGHGFSMRRYPATRQGKLDGSRKMRCWAARP